MEYRTMSERDSALNTFPGLTQKELDTVDRLHPAYILYQDDGRGGKQTRTVWTTCCHHNRTIGVIEQLEDEETDFIRCLSHGEEVMCPYCGREAKVKNRKRIKNWKRYSDYIPVVFVHTAPDGNTIWLQAYWTTKNLGPDPTGRPLYKSTAAYMVQPGLYRQWNREYDFLHGKGKLVEDPGYWGKDPFIGADEGYRVIGLDQIRTSFLKYAMVDKPLREEEYCTGRKALLRYMAIACRYPRQVEMLRKAGMDMVVEDAVYRRKKNKAAIDWEQTDPRKAFDLSKQELREFMDTQRKVMTLVIYKTLRKTGKPIKMEDAAHWGERMDPGDWKRLCGEAKRIKVEIYRVLNYLKKMEEKTRPWCVNRLYVDYIEEAIVAKLPLHRDDVLFPKNLIHAHDDAVDKANARRAQHKREQAKKEAEDRAKKYAARQEKLKKKYEFELDGLEIKIPESEQEIINEGIALKHCVGGYAERHFKGSTTILFLRKKSNRNTPYVTIEMSGNDIVQMHGYKNERYRTPDGSRAVSPRKVHKRFVDSWIDWLNRGSPRMEDGTPKLKKQKVSEVA